MPKSVTSGIPGFGIPGVQTHSRVLPSRQQPGSSGPQKQLGLPQQPHQQPAIAAAQYDPAAAGLSQDQVQQYVATLQRTINCLSDPDRSTRRNAASSLATKLLKGDATTQKASPAMLQVRRGFRACIPPGWCTPLQSLHAHMPVSSESSSASLTSIPSFCVVASISHIDRLHMGHCVIACQQQGLRSLESVGYFSNPSLSARLVPQKTCPGPLALFSSCLPAGVMLVSRSAEPTTSDAAAARAALHLHRRCCVVSCCSR